MLGLTLVVLSASHLRDLYVRREFLEALCCSLGIDKGGSLAFEPILRMPLMSESTASCRILSWWAGWDRATANHRLRGALA